MIARCGLTAGALAALALTGCGGPSEDERDRAVTAAGDAFAEAEAGGEDLSDGPCIADPLPEPPGWVADIAHDPREAVDDQPQNQCQAYRSGRADHFVELSPEGELIGTG